MRAVVCGILFVLLAVIVTVTLADGNGGWSTVWLGAAGLCIGAVAIVDIRRLRRE